jgi:hypothetical protein
MEERDSGGRGIRGSGRLSCSEHQTEGQGRRREACGRGYVGGDEMQRYRTCNETIFSCQSE